MNATITTSHITRLDAHEPRAGYDFCDGHPYWSRMIVAHGSHGDTLTLVLLSDDEDGLDLIMPESAVPAALKRLNVEELDALIDAARAERQSRDGGLSAAQDFAESPAMTAEAAYEQALTDALSTEPPPF
jgi:hypothetical protein